MIANAQPVLKATAELVHAIHTSDESLPREICQLADMAEHALYEYQVAVDYHQERKTNYRGKRR